MIGSSGADAEKARREGRFVSLVQAVAAVIVLGWFASGHASAPDDGLLQLDILTLHEKVAGVEPVDGHPTMVVLAGTCSSDAKSSLPSSYGVVVHHPNEPAYAGLAQDLALPAAAGRCQPGYVLVDRAGFVRYRTYDPGWAAHSDEQSILLDAL